MDAAAFLKDFSNVGLGVMIFVMWYYENRKRETDTRKIDALQVIVQEQVQDKKTMREERAQFVQLLENHAALIGRAMGLLDRMEERQGRVIEKKV